MISWGASVQWPGPGVGCFDPAMVLHRMQEFFGSALDFDGDDLLSGYYERIVSAAADCDVSLDSAVVVSAAKLVREVSPRYIFRLKIGPEAFVAGQVDRYGIAVTCQSDADFPEPIKGQFIQFLTTLKLGEVTFRRSGERNNV
jgi:hypothetical protein